MSSDKRDTGGLAVAVALIGCCGMFHLVAAVGVAGVVGGVTRNAWVVGLALVALAGIGLLWWRNRRAAARDDTARDR